MNPEYKRNFGISILLFCLLVGALRWQTENFLSRSESYLSNWNDRGQRIYQLSRDNLKIFDDFQHSIVELNETNENTRDVEVQKLSIVQEHLNDLAQMEFSTSKVQQASADLATLVSAFKSSQYKFSLEDGAQLEHIFRSMHLEASDLLENHFRNFRSHLDSNMYRMFWINIALILAYIASLYFLFRKRFRNRKRRGHRSRRPRPTSPNPDPRRPISASTHGRHPKQNNRGHRNHQRRHNRHTPK